MQLQDELEKHTLLQPTTRLPKPATRGHLSASACPNSPRPLLTAGCSLMQMRLGAGPCIAGANGAVGKTRRAWKSSRLELVLSLEEKEQLLPNHCPAQSWQGGGSSSSICKRDFSRSTLIWDPIFKS